ncbi:acVLRF1 family peptidyl-tRNA hydrolase [Virgisporangium aliadipatigenens]|uniref:acVLRF1 family peptidyl-tRNA hydrolase n=1 Tax=Virgisporangium aliadipatigenens TaxID=741659 RepID=UPI00194405FB|nr:acVLRF1 family peptidyl-tRNA hydrolase [Virgisporangium aliadipatigenens]
MVNARPAAGGGRWVDISPERLRGWLDGFYGRHDGATEEGLTLTGSSNGDTATLHPPPGATAVSTVDALLEAVARPKPIGLLLARKGAAAAGVHSGLKLVASKVERFYVQGRTAAGGWSQQRYARRRGNQTDAAVSGAADVAARVLLPVGGTVSLVCGGDRAMVDAVLEDPRLAPLVPLRHAHFLDVAEPRLNVLEEAAVVARRVRIHLVP